MENINQPVAPNSVPESGTYNKPKLTPVFTIFKKSVALWWKNLDKILKIYWEGIKPTLIILIVFAVLTGLTLIITKNVVVLNALKIAVALVGIVTLVFVAYFWTRAYMGVFLLVKKDYKDEPNKTFAETKNLFWPYIGLSLLTALLVLCWMLLLIIPGLIFSILYSFAVYAFFFEGKKGMAAIRRSRALAKGYFWPVVGRFLVLIVISIIFMSIVSAPITSMAPNSVGAQVWNFIAQIISWLVGPIALFFSYNIYTDLVKIKR